MRKTVLIIILALTCLSLTSCRLPRLRRKAPPATRTEASIGGIKIADLKPTDSPLKPSQVRITVFTYEMPAENASVVTNVYETLPKVYLKFSSPKTFQANGFEAGFGQKDMWNPVGDSLGLALARTAKTDNLLFLDSSTNEVVAGRALQGQTFYLYKRSGYIETVTLKGGQFLWRIKARALPERKGVALVQIQALQKEIGSRTAKLMSAPDTGENVYHDMGIKLHMSPGDFVVIGPGSEESSQIKLGDLFFQRRGDIILPKIEDKSAGQSQTQPLYKIEKNIPLTRVYVFACMGVEN